MTVQPSVHPAERGRPGERGRFDSIAQSVSHVASSAGFFLACIVLIGAWGLSFALGADATVRDLTAEGMTAVTLLLVALVQNADLRAEAAVQLKLDAIAEALIAQSDDEDVRRKLEDAVGLHKRL